MLGPRILAFVIDSGLVAVMVLLSLLVNVDLVFLAVAVNLAVLLYFAIGWSRLGGGQTIGMRVTGIRISRSDGRDVGLPRAVVRYLGLEIGFMFLGLPLLLAVVRGNRQALHDTIADTLVVATS